MSKSWHRVVNSLVPFIMFGIVIALFVGLIIMFSYVLFWGLIIGIILWIAAVITDFLFPAPRNISLHGRIIEYKKKFKKRR